MLYAEALEGRRRVLGNDHPATLSAINNMGVTAGHGSTRRRSANVS